MSAAGPFGGQWALQTPPTSHEVAAANVDLGRESGATFAAAASRLIVVSRSHPAGSHPRLCAAATSWLNVDRPLAPKSRAVQLGYFRSRELASGVDGALD